jgi:hypothetical protein
MENILKNPSSILPYYRGEGFFYENIQFIKTDVFPCHRGNTKGYCKQEDEISL